MRQEDKNKKGKIDRSKMVGKPISMTAGRPEGVRTIDDSNQPICNNAAESLFSSAMPQRRKKEKTTWLFSAFFYKALGVLLFLMFFYAYLSD